MWSFYWPPTPLFLVSPSSLAHPLLCTIFGSIVFLLFLISNHIFHISHFFSPLLVRSELLLQHLNEAETENIPSLDLAAMDDGCSSHLARSNSDSSYITVESSFQYHATLGQSAEWTNEKHNAYLGFLEASFVQQLHQLHYSAGSQGMRSQEKKWGSHSSQPLLGNTCYSSHQLMVLQDDCWQNIKPAEKESLFDSTADSHGILENPRIRRFTSIGEPQTATSFDLQEHSVLCDEGFCLRESAEPAGRSEQGYNYCLCHQNSVGSTTEVSDDNFVHIDQGHESSCGPNSKRLKTAAVDYSKEDQVVLLEKFHTPHVSAVSHASSEREEEEHHELLSEHPESFACPRSDVHYFLRGS